MNSETNYSTTLSTSANVSFTYLMSIALVIICIVTNQKLFVIPIALLLIYLLLRGSYFWVTFENDHFTFKNPIKRQILKFNYNQVKSFKIDKLNFAQNGPYHYSITIKFHEKTENEFKSLVLTIQNPDPFKIFLSKKGKLISG